MARSAHRKPWYRKVRYWLLIALGVIVVAVAAGLQPLTRYETRKALDNLQGFRGDFKDAHVSLIPLRYTITHLKLEAADTPKAPPVFYANRAWGQLNWGQLFKGHVVASATIDRMKVTVLQKPQVKPPPKPTAASATLSEQLRKAMPVDIDQISVKDGQVLYVMAEQPDRPAIWLHELNATLENLATRARLAQGPTTLALSGTVQTSGKLSIFATADPLKRLPTFAGQARLVGLKLQDLGEIIEGQSKMRPTQGSVDVFTRFEAKGGRITGGVKPVLKDAKLTSASPNLGDKLKSLVADVGLKLFSDRVPGRNAVATVIPIEGNIDTADVQVWPTILGVVRNAFVQGLTESFRNVPPPQASKPQSPLTQARRGLSKSGVPEAQPAPRSGGQKK